jgi:hypothetical protein
MKHIRCEREMEVVGAMRTGTWTADLGSHVRDCAICAETRLVAERLLESAEVLRTGHDPIAADRIWQQAQARRQEVALQRAAAPLIFMHRLSLACVIAFATWLLHSFWHMADGKLMRGWTLPGIETATMGAAIAVVSIAVGAWYLLRESDRAVSSV